MATDSAPDVLIIRTWPKMIFLWPTAAVALLAGIMSIALPSWGNITGGIFLTTLAINLVVLTFDFPRSTSLTVFITVVSVVLGLVLLNQSFGIIGPLQTWLASLQVNASRDFYFTIFIVMFILFIGMSITTRFDYWEITSNELIHHSGLLGDIERFSTAGLKLTTEINDVFEFLLAGAGRIILNIPGNARPVVLDNVLRISYLMKASNDLLSHRVVEVTTDAKRKEDVLNQQKAEYE